MKKVTKIGSYVTGDQKTTRYGIVGFNVPLDTLQVISETILQVT